MCYLAHKPYEILYTNFKKLWLTQLSQPFDQTLSGD